MSTFPFHRPSTKDNGSSCRIETGSVELISNFRMNGGPDSMRSKKIQTVTIMMMIIALCITCISIFMYNISADSIKQEVKSAYNVSLLNTRERIENYFQQMNQLTLQFEKVPEVEHLIQNKPDQVELGTVLKLMTRMHASIDYVDNVVIYNPRSRELMATNGSMVPEYLNYQPVIEKFEELGTASAFIRTLIHDIPTTVMIRKLPVFSEMQTVYILFHVNRSLFDTYLGTSTYNNSGSYFIMDEYGQLLANRGVFDDLTLSPLISRINEATPAVKEDTSVVFSTDDTFITFLPPSYNGWRYAFAISNRTFLHKAIGLRDVTLRISILLFVIAIMISFVSSHWLWKGWHKMKSLLDNNPVGVEPQALHNEFDLYLTKVQTIVNQSKHLKKQTDEMLPQLKEAISLSILENGARAPEALNKFKQYEIPFKEGSFGCFCVAIDSPKEGAEHYSSWDVAALEYAVVSVMKEVVEEHAHGFVVNTLKSHAAAVVSSEGSNSEVLSDTIRHITQTIRQFVEQYFPVTVSIGVSRIRSDVSHLNICYSEAYEMLNKKLISGSNHIYYANESDGGQLFEEPIPFREMGNDIFYGIRTRNRDFAYQALESLHVLEAAENVNYKWFQSKMIELTQSIFRQFHDRYEGLDIREPILGELLQLSTLGDWIGWMKRACIDSCIVQLEKKHQSSIASVSRKIEAYVMEHIETELQIEACCKSLQIPVSFAKQALKDEWGITFNELIMRTRIEQAKAWLEADDYSVEEVARRLQYSNAQNFSRMFKKAVGVPPGQYRTGVKYPLNK